jgi:MFS family permease
MRRAAAAGVAGPATGSGRRGGGDFALLWGAQTTSALGTAVSTVALPLVAVTALAASTFQVGLVAAAGYAAWLAFGLPSGVHVDRLRRRPLLLSMDAVRGVALASIPAAWAAGVLSLAQLVVVALVVGSATVYFDVAFQSYLPSIVPPADLVAANSALQGSESAAQVAGPALGGVLVQALGAPAAVLADAASYLVSVLCTLRVRRVEPPPARPPAAGLLPQVGVGLRFVRRHPVIGPLTVTAGIFNFAAAGIQALVVVFLVRTLAVAPGMVGVLLASLGLGGVAGAAAASWLGARVGSARALFLSVAVGPLSALLIPLSTSGPGLLFFATGAAGVSASMVVFSVLARSYRQSATPPELLGRVTATVRFLSWGVLPAGALVAGGLGEVAGNRAALWAVCATLLLTPVPLVRSPLRHARDLPTEPVAATATSTSDST